MSEDKKSKKLNKQSCEDLLPVLKFFNDFLKGYGTPDLPKELISCQEIVNLYEYLKEIKTTLIRFSSGQLNFKINQKGALAGYLKSLNSNLKHLAWQLHVVASGDLSQRVDYFGEFSLAFNQMVKNLAEQRAELKKQQDQLLNMTKELQKEIRQRDTIEAALRASESTYRQLALRDSLTGIYNRGYFFEIALREIENIKRNGNDLCFLMIDVDFFKNFNDTYGHLSGDSALIHLTNTVGPVLRKSDLLARFGGEEFVVLLNNTYFDGGIAIAERIRSTLANKPNPAPNCEKPITVSIGLSCLTSAKALTSSDTTKLLNETLMEADAALYQAKDSGRNKVCWSGWEQSH